MLVVYEGIHSAGKSAQVDALAEWLRAAGVDHHLTSWNSSAPIGGEITKLKIENRMTPVAMALLEAGDLWSASGARRAATRVPAVHRVLRQSPAGRRAGTPGRSAVRQTGVAEQEPDPARRRLTLADRTGARRIRRHTRGGDPWRAPSGSAGTDASASTNTATRRIATGWPASGTCSRTRSRHWRR